MGVSGAGKSTVAALLADRLGLPFGEGDEFHSPANVAKMASGTPLDDTDRAPWLAALGTWLADRAADGTGAVLSCSALRRSYRDTLRAACPQAYFLHLTGSPELLRSRLSARTGHYMKADLLDSQLATLEPLAEDEPGLTLPVGPTAEALAAQAVELLSSVTAPSA